MIIFLYVKLLFNEADFPDFPIPTEIIPIVTTDSVCG